jgi:tRNA pseudouridine32 synthase/23S rRNA pseudouridine746 synthase
MTDINELAQLPATTEPWQLCYQDEFFIVVNKPAHLLTVPGRHPANHDCLISRVQSEFPSAQVVHRLDYDTSGLVILPLTKAALSHISKQFQARTVSKFYEALVSGEIAEQGSIDGAIAADLDNRPLYKIAIDGKASLTHYQRLAFDANTKQSRVHLEPVTGRSHQLRLHLSSIGHAIIGDTLYAAEEIAQASPRLCLHARQIHFIHPVTTTELILQAPAPF